MPARLIHGDRRPLHPLYSVWRDIKNRCNSPGLPSFKNYGGRGISVCKQWSQDYLSFKQWALDSGYEDGLEIDRIDNDGDYEPKNCRWVSTKINSRNRRTNKTAVAFGEEKLMIEWAEDHRCKVSYNTFWRRVSKGWHPETALTQISRKELRT